MVLFAEVLLIHSNSGPIDLLCSSAIVWEE
jgi:hypothetical protein